MTRYVGLTDDLARRREQHGYPPDWSYAGPFTSEAAARAWQAKHVGHPAYQCGPGGDGWRYGYWYTITYTTKQ